jgi:hypothetical protein
LRWAESARRRRCWDLASSRDLAWDLERARMGSWDVSSEVKGKWTELEGNWERDSGIVGRDQEGFRRVQLWYGLSRRMREWRTWLWQRTRHLSIVSCVLRISSPQQKGRTLQFDILKIVLFTFFRIVHIIHVHLIV